MEFHIKFMSHIWCFSLLSDDYTHKLDPFLWRILNCKIISKRVKRGGGERENENKKALIADVNIILIAALTRRDQRQTFSRQPTLLCQTTEMCCGSSRLWSRAPVTSKCATSPSISRSVNSSSAAGLTTASRWLNFNFNLLYVQCESLDYNYSIVCTVLYLYTVLVHVEFSGFILQRSEIIPASKLCAKLIWINSLQLKISFLN